jgi:glycosyltransferase involved in cell wall biosynthesis
MKILHITGARSWGGNEQQLADVIPELNKKNVESIIFGVKDSPIHNYSIKQNIEFICCKQKKLNKLKSYIYLKKVVNEINPDIIHLHTSDSVTVYAISDLLFKLRTPTVFSKKGISRKVGFLSKYKYNYKNIYKILCVSKVVKTHFEEVLNKKNHHKLCVVYDGVKVNHNERAACAFNLKKEYNISNKTKIIGNIANHTNAKNLVTLVKILNVLINEKKLENIHFIQIGEFTRATPELKSLVTSYDLENYITFTNFKEKASSFLPQFDVFLMTSIREGGPTSVLEAFYKKVPVVSTNVGVVEEAIEDDVNGFIANIEDYNMLADKVEILLENKSLRNSFREISYQKFLKSFTTQKLGENTFKVYKEVLANN